MPTRGRKIAEFDADLGPTCLTSERRLRYQRLGLDHWRFVLVGTGRNVGPVYRSERELLADLPRFRADLDRWLAEDAKRKRVRVRRPRKGEQQEGGGA